MSSPMLLPMPFPMSLPISSGFKCERVEKLAYMHPNS